VATRGGDDDTTHGLIDCLHPAYPDVLNIATRALAANDQVKANTRTAADHNRTASLAAYRKGDAVGVHIDGKNPRKASVRDALPCVIIEVLRRVDEDGLQSDPRTMYRVASPQGVLARTYKLDRLVPLSINNYPALLELRKSYAIASAGDIRAELTVTLTEAWTKHRAAYHPATATTAARQQQQQQRAATQRAAAAVAQSAILASQSSTVQPPPGPAAPLRSQDSDAAPSPSFIVKIIGANKRSYKVQWSQPVECPEWTLESRRTMHRHSDQPVRELAQAWDEQAAHDAAVAAVSTRSPVSSLQADDYDGQELRVDWEPSEALP
jgi:hypothetical protein